MRAVTEYSVSMLRLACISYAKTTASADAEHRQNSEVSMTLTWLNPKVHLTIITVVILVLALACGSAAEPQGSSSQSAGSETVAKPVAAPATSAPVVAVGPEGHLKIAYTSLGNDGIYPKSSNINAGGKDIQSTIYDVIIGSNAHGIFSKDTGLASNWSMTEDALHHTINLREGVKFHNGDDVTSADVMYSIEEVMEDDSQTSFIKELTPLLDNLETPDQNTLKINCSKPCLFAPWIFSGVRGSEANVVNKKYYEEVGEAGFAKSPIGSGPYQFEEQVLGSSIRVEAVGSEHFRGGKIKYQTISFLGIPEETTRVAMLKSGEADIIDVSRERVDSLSEAGFNLFYKERADLMGAYFFQQWEDESPFKDIKVREALNLAINREAILEHIFSGRGGYAFYPMGSYALESGLNPELVRYPYDPDRALVLLKEAGFTEDKPLEVKLAIYPFGGIAEFPRMIEAIGADFESVGVKVIFQPTEYGTLRDMRRAKELAGWVGPWGTTNRAAPAEILSITRALYHGEAPLTTYRNPDFNAIMDKAFASLDEESVKGQITQMQQWLYDDFYGIPLFEVDTPFATSTDITSWDLGRDSYDKNLDSIVFIK